METQSETRVVEGSPGSAIIERAPRTASRFIEKPHSAGIDPVHGHARDGATHGKQRDATEGKKSRRAAESACLTADSPVPLELPYTSAFL